MNVLNYRISLDMFDAVSQITIKAKKGDSACRINITLTENGKIYHISEGSYATFHAKKFDGNFVDGKCTIENNTIVYDFTSSIDNDGVAQISACEGIAECDVTLYNDKNEKLTSPRFNLFIDGTVYNGEEIFSTTKSDVLEKLIGDYVSSNYPIEQSHNPNSENAQSGKAVAEAVNSIIKQTVSGDVVTFNDVSPIEHNLKVNVKSKNLLPQSLNVTLPYTQNGITVSQVNAGVYLSGNYTGPAGYTFSLGTVTLPAGTYIAGGLITRGAGDEAASIALWLGGSSNNITLTEEKDVSIVVQIGHYVSTTIKVEAYVYPVVISKEYVDGYAFNEYIPHNLDLSTVNVSRYGKNLCDNIFEKGEINSSTGANQTNSSVYSVRTKNYIPILPNTEYTMINPVKSKSRKVRYYKKDKSFLSTSSNFISSGTDSLIRTATTPNGAYYMRIQIDCDTTDLATEIRNGNHKYQFELGSSATPYEECNIKTVNADADGIVNGLTSISPSMTLITDGGAVLECKYNVDTKTYIDNKFAELSAAILNS